MKETISFENAKLKVNVLLRQWSIQKQIESKARLSNIDHSKCKAADGTLIDQEDVLKLVNLLIRGEYRISRESEWEDYWIFNYDEVNPATGESTVLLGGSPVFVKKSTGEIYVRNGSKELELVELTE